LDVKKAKCDAENYRDFLRPLGVCSGEAQCGKLEAGIGEVTNEQLYLAMGVPALINAVLIGILMAYVNAKFDAVTSRFDGVNSKFESINSKFEVAHAELLRVEGVLDARLQNVEQRLKMLEEKVH
jgi:hypothetical protein